MAIEPEFNRMAPEGVSCHYHRFAFKGGSQQEEVVERLSNAQQFVGEAAEMITHVQPAVVAMTGTGVSFIGGYDYDQKLIRIMKERNGNLPTTTTTTSVIDALRAMGITKVSMAMPYLEKVARTAIKFVEDSGFRVVDAKWLNKNSIEIPRLSMKCSISWREKSTGRRVTHCSCPVDLAAGPDRQTGE
jgi:maleate isomerase